MSIGPTQVSAGLTQCRRLIDELVAGIALEIEQ